MISDRDHARPDSNTSRVRLIQWLATLISLVLTAVVVMQDAMLNGDGVLYLLSAELLAQGQWRDAFAQHWQPLYPAMIAAMHWVTGANMELSAYLLNAVLQAMVVFAFIGLVAEMGGDSRTVVVAAALILSYPDFNEYRSEIIRDFGYWAFFLTAVLLYLKHSRTLDYRLFSLALLSLLVAGLFRVEGFVFAGLFPLAKLLDGSRPVQSRIAGMARIYAVFLALAISAIVVVLLSGERLASSFPWQQPWSYVTGFIQSISSDLNGKAEFLSKHYLSRYSEGYAPAVVAATMLLILFGEVLSSIGLVYGVGVVYALRYAGARMAVYPRRIVLSAAAVSLLMLGLFVFSMGFLTGRYPVALTLMLVTLVPFGVVVFYDRYQRKPHGRGSVIAMRAGVGLLILYLFVDGLFSFSPGKWHERDAAQWMRDNLASTDRVFSFDSPILYRAGKLGAGDQGRLAGARVKGDAWRLHKLKTWQEVLEDGGWKQYDYLVVAIGRKKQAERLELEAAIGRKPFKVFENRRGDRVLIYATGTQ